MQEFVDTAITDPGQLAALAKDLRRRPLRRSAWVWWILTGAIAAVALVAGLVLGHFVP